MAYIAKCQKDTCQCFISLGQEFEVRLTFYDETLIFVSFENTACLKNDTMFFCLTFAKSWSCVLLDKYRNVLFFFRFICILKKNY